LVYNRALSAAERQQVEQVLSQKYGLILSAGSGGAVELAASPTAAGAKTEASPPSPTLGESGIPLPATVSVLVSTATGESDGQLRIMSMSVKLNEVQLEFSACHDRTYNVEVSEDLIHWRRIGTVLGGTQGLSRFSDDQGRRTEVRFYRVRSAP
jgi:hypothetical protein